MPILGVELSELPVSQTTALVTCVVLVVASYILMLINARILGKAKGYGVRKRETCGNEYLELETARYELFKAYDKASRRIMVAINMMLLIGLGIPLLVSAINYFSLNNRVGDGTAQRLLIPLAIFLWFATVITYFKFIAKEGASKKVSKYLSTFNKQFDKNEQMRSVKVLTIAVPILVVFAISTWLLHKQGSDAIKIKVNIGLGISFLLTTMILILIARDRVALQRDVYQKYLDAKSGLQQIVLALKNNPEFRRYLDINIRRAHPNIQGDGLTDEEPYSSELYAYVEHRPGRDSWSSKEGYTTVAMAKDVFKEYIDAAPTVQAKIDLMELLQTMYIQGESLDTFKLTDIETWLKAIFSISSTDSSTSTSLSTGMTSTPIVIAQSQDVQQEAQRTQIYEAIFAKIQEAAKVANSSVESLSYTTLASVIQTYAKSPVDEEDKILTPAPSGDHKLILDHLMTYIVHMSTYKHNVNISFESIQYYLETASKVDETVISDMRNKFDDLEKTRVGNSTLMTFQKAMRSARGVEDAAIKSTAAYLSKVILISAILLAFVVYVMIRICMQTIGPDITYIVFAGGLLLGVFAITWYSWFYAKLKL